MKHTDRLDLPKGHIEEGETETVCALRELHEETGIPPALLELDPTFRFEAKYHASCQRLGGEQVEKTLVVFLGWLADDVQVTPSEHVGFEWHSWNPPHRIQARTIDPLLVAVENHLAQRSETRP